MYFHLVRILEGQKAESHCESWIFPLNLFLRRFILASSPSPYPSTIIHPSHSQPQQSYYIQSTMPSPQKVTLLDQMKKIRRAQLKEKQRSRSNPHQPHHQSHQSQSQPPQSPSQPLIQSQPHIQPQSASPEPHQSPSPSPEPSDESQQSSDDEPLQPSVVVEIPRLQTPHQPASTSATRLQSLQQPISISGKTPNIPVKHPCDLCLKQGISCEFHKSSKSYKCFNCYSTGKGPCRVTSKPLETEAMVKFAKREAKGKSTAATKSPSTSSNLTKPPQPPSRPRESSSNLSKPSQPPSRPRESSTNLSKPSQPPSKPRESSATSSNLKRASQYVISDDDSEDDEPLSKRPRVVKPLRKPHQSPSQPPSASVESPSTSWQPPQPHLLSRKRPLPQVKSSPWLDLEIELRESIWEAFGRIRFMHSSISDPQVRNFLQFLDLELEELLNLMGSSPGGSRSKRL